MAETGADCISIDWRTPLAVADKELPKHLAIQGNFNPTNLFGSVDSVRAGVGKMLGEVSARPRYIANLGHGVLPETPPEMFGLCGYCERCWCLRLVRELAVRPLSLHLNFSFSLLLILPLFRANLRFCFLEWCFKQK